MEKVSVETGIKVAEIAVVSGLLTGGAMIFQGDGWTGGAKSAGVQVLSSAVVHGISEVALSASTCAPDSFAGLAVEAVATGMLFAAAERWGRGSRDPIKDALTSSIADFAAATGVVYARQAIQEWVAKENAKKAAAAPPA